MWLTCKANTGQAGTAKGAAGEGLIQGWHSGFLVYPVLPLFFGLVSTYETQPGGWSVPRPCSQQLHVEYSVHCKPLALVNVTGTDSVGPSSECL